MNKNLKDTQKMLIVVDLVKGFVTEGAMADKYIQHIVPESKRLVESYLKKGDPVMYIKDCHEKNSAEFNHFPEHCLRGTKEAEMVDELLTYENDTIVVEKNATGGAIFVRSFVETMEQLNKIDEVVIIGCCTDICVLNLAIELQCYFDQHNRNATIVVPKNAVETYDSPNHPRDEYNEIAFKLMSQAGIKLV